MGWFEIALTAVALSMDAFAVAVCKGLAMKKITFVKALIVGLWFGIFQGLMPLIGYFLGSAFEQFVKPAAPFIAFVLLGFIGVNMIREACSHECECCGDEDDSLSFGKMLTMAIATSIDALAVGITFALEGFTGGGLNIFTAVLLIGIVTCVLSMGGVKIGNIFGSKYEKKAEFVGGVVLIGIGLKILIEGIIELCA
jgi:putative Mn2+ efflux pump MntP